MNEEDALRRLSSPKNPSNDESAMLCPRTAGAGSDAYHSEFVERAGHLSDRRFYVRKGRAGESANRFGYSLTMRA